MSVLSNFTVSIAKGLRRVRHKELCDQMSGQSNRSQHVTQEPRLKMNKCLIVSKVTRYEYEKHSHDNISDGELEKVLRMRGSDYDSMITSHREQKTFEEGVAVSLKRMGLQVEMASRLTYNDELISWCDLVVPCGGDGTFLLAASRVRDANKPVIGFNSAPHRSIGRLCLPTWCSNDVKGAFQALKEGRFRWMRRSRIRTTVTSEPKVLDTMTPIDLHTLNYSRYPPVSNPLDSLDARSGSFNESSPTLATKVLPFLALNEVFIGESVTSRVSLLRLQVDNGKWTHTKSSGLCVTTGTGSTSWHYSINCLRTHSVLELMKTLNEEFDVNMDISLEKARQIAERYNQKLMFPPESSQLAYSVREYITFEEWPAPRGLRGRDRANAVRVRSHCADAGYRYELYCASKASKSTQCTVYTIRNHEDAWNDNELRCEKDDNGVQMKYTEEIFNALTKLRFEEPNSNNRWDSPLFTVQPHDELDLEAVYKVLYEKKPPPPNMSTQNPPLSSTNFLYELDRVTQAITKHILDCKQLNLDEVKFPDYPGCVLEVGIMQTINQQRLLRLRRQFLTYAKMNYSNEDANKIGRYFIQYLNGVIEVA